MMTPEFTTSWFSDRIPLWQQLWRPWMDRPNVHVLEIGSYEGASALWLIHHVLTGEGSSIMCVDPWQDRDVFDRFNRNTDEYQLSGKCATRTISSAALWDWPARKYDAIYVDGDHSSLAVMRDAVNSWRLLKPNGMLLFDDYEWTDDLGDGPKPAIEAFITMMGERARVTYRGAQVSLRKVR